MRPPLADLAAELRAAAADLPADGDLAPLLAAIGELCQVRDAVLPALDAALDARIVAAHAAGASFAVLGSALGTTRQRAQTRYRLAVARASRRSSLAEVLDIVLDRGVVIDASVRAGLLGVQLTTFDARVVAASVDTYQQSAEDQQSAEAVNRLDLQPEQEPKGLPELIEGEIEGTATTVIEGEIEGTATTVIEETLDRPAQRVGQLGEEVADPVERLVEKVIGGEQLGEEVVTDPVGQLVEKVIGGGQLGEEATDAGDEDRD